MSAAAQRAAQKAKKGEPEVYNFNSLKHNAAVLGYIRTFMSVVAGIAVGLFGATGLQGFALHLVTQLLCAVPLMLQGAVNAKMYFGSWYNLLFGHVMSSSTLLSFILFWMIFYNLAHVF